MRAPLFKTIRMTERALRTAGECTIDLNVLTRELRADERPQLLAHLLALGTEDRRLRFTHSITDSGLSWYVDNIDLRSDVVFVATDTNLAIAGAAHLACHDGHAQLGVSVLPNSRGRGIGSGLLERCITRTRNWGVRVMFMNCLVENAPMMRLARRQGLRVAVSGPEAEAFVRLPGPDLESVATEAVAEHLGLFDHAQKSYWLSLRDHLRQ